jgi:hypothetical protein
MSSRGASVTRRAVPSNWLTHGDEDLYAWHDLTANSRMLTVRMPSAAGG